MVPQTLAGHEGEAAHPADSVHKSSPMPSKPVVARQIANEVHDRHMHVPLASQRNPPAENRLTNALDPQLASYAKPDATQPVIRQPSSYSTVPSSMRDAIARTRNDKFQIGRASLQKYDHKDQQVMTRVPVESRAIAKYGAGDRRRPGFTPEQSQREHAAQAVAPSTHALEQSRPTTTQPEAPDVLNRIARRPDWLVNSWLAGAHKRNQMSTDIANGPLGHITGRDDMHRMSEASQAITTRVPPMAHERQLLHSQWPSGQSPNQPGIHNQVAKLPSTRSQALAAPQAWAGPSAPLLHGLADLRQNLNSGLFGQMSGGLLAGSGNFSTSRVRTTILIDPGSGAMSGVQQCDTTRRGPDGQVRMDSERRSFSRD